MLGQHLKETLKGRGLFSLREHGKNHHTTQEKQTKDLLTSLGCLAAWTESQRSQIHCAKLSDPREEMTATEM